MNNLIGLTGFARSGKSSISKWFEQSKGYQILSFATPVKDIARDCFGWDGEKDDKGRKLLQVIGTEAGRTYNPNIWVEIMRTAIASLPSDSRIIIDDIRFQNEVDLIRELGGEVYRVYKEGYLLSSDSHASEQTMELKVDSVWILPNFDGDLDKLNKHMESKWKYYIREK